MAILGISGSPKKGGNTDRMIQPWFKKKFHDAPEVLGKVRIHYPFYIDEMPESGLVFCMETPHEFDVKVNGQEVSRDDD